MDDDSVNLVSMSSIHVQVERSEAPAGVHLSSETLNRSSKRRQKKEKEREEKNERNTQ